MNRFAENIFIENMRLLSELQQFVHGQSQIVLSTITQKSLYQKILKRIIQCWKNISIYNIKICNENDNFKIECIIPIYIRCYNYCLGYTDFSSQYLLKNDITFNYSIGWPILSPYNFLEIIYLSHCEDLLIESLVYLPLDICVDILKITVDKLKYLQFSQVRRIIFLLIYKIYYKCLWLHLGVLSEQNVIKCVGQLVKYFEMLCDLLVNTKFIVSNQNNQPCSHYLIILKYLLRYVKKCMHSKIENYSENHKLAKLFTLTYGNSSDHYENYYHMLSTNEVKFIIMKFDEQLIILLLKQIKKVNFFGYMAWEKIVDDENPMITLQRSILIECHHLIKFFKQNEFLMPNKDLLNILEKFMSSSKLEKSVLTLEEIYHSISNGNLYSTKELIKRYEEWDLSTLDFISKNIKLFDVNFFYVMLKYFHYGFPKFRTEKYKIYISVLKILLQLKIQDLHSVMLKYIQNYFNSTSLIELFDQNSFKVFIDRDLFSENPNNLMQNISKRKQKISHYALLFFILLNPTRTLNTLLVYEVNVPRSKSILFQRNIYAIFLRNCFNLEIGRYNIMTCILKNIILQEHITLCTSFKEFMDNVMKHQIMTADNIMNELYIPCLTNSYFNTTNLYNILSHIINLLHKNLCTNKTNYFSLIVILNRTASLLRRCNLFSKCKLFRRLDFIHRIIWILRVTNKITEEMSANLQMIHNKWKYVEPLDMKIIFPNMSSLQIIKEYENRCFVVHQRLRTNLHCHPKLRSYIRSFNLNREACIRQMILLCFESEYEILAKDLTFNLWYHFGWTSSIMAYENVLRITMDALQVVLKYPYEFPVNTFITLLLGTIKFYKVVILKFHKVEIIYHIMVKALSSIDYTVSKTCYAKMYNDLLTYLQNTKPLQIKIYFHYIFDLINVYNRENETSISSDNDSDEIEEITTMYNIYIFISECTKIFNMKVQHYSEKLLYNLDSTGHIILNCP